MLRQARPLAALALALPLAAAPADRDQAPPDQPTERVEAGLAEGSWIEPTATHAGFMQGLVMRNDRHLAYDLRATVWQFFPAGPDEARYGNLRGMLRSPTDIVGGAPIELRLQGNWRIRAGGRTGEFQALLFLPFGHEAIPILPVGAVEGVIQVPLLAAGGGQATLNAESRQAAPRARLPRSSAPGDQQHLRDEARGDVEGQAVLNSLARSSAPRDRVLPGSAGGDQQFLRQEARGEVEGQASIGLSIGADQVDPRGAAGAGQAQGGMSTKQVGGRGDAGAGQVQLDRTFVARWSLAY